jgi:hypothetical protein
MPISLFHFLDRYRDTYAGNSKFRVIDRMREAPKFVFSRDVRDFINDHRGAYSDSLAATLIAGHTELPHNPMVVEYDVDSRCRIFWLVIAQGGGHYRLAGAVLDHGKPQVMDGYLPIELSPQGKWRAWKFFGRVDIPEEDDSLSDFENEAFKALFYAMALHVRGIITRPPKPIDPALERARLKRGLLPTFKDYVTVHIGYVTDRAGKRHDYKEGFGHHVRVHLRRGHTRNQACGRDLLEHKEIWISAVLVNYRPGVTVADTDYLVVP